MSTLTKSKTRIAVENGQADETPILTQRVQISPPNIQKAKFLIIGTAPLVTHKFSAKAQEIMRNTMAEGSLSRKGKKREKADFEQLYQEARYVSNDGWDGFNASGPRSAMISACRLVGYKMVLAKLSVFVVADGYDAKNPEIPLVRIQGKPERIETVGRVQSGSAYIIVRPKYFPWSATVNVEYDADQFTYTDVSNLLMRVGRQVGICEGRPDSKESAGMGWGTFRLANEEEVTHGRAK